MPIKELSMKQFDMIYETIGSYYFPEDVEELIEALNHDFAKIYGYRRPGRAKSRVRDSRPKAKKPRSKKQKANDKRIGRLMKQGYSMKEAHRVNRGGY